jgi:acyl-CoA synthetase (AMP-forming)/AMP-acid ligase II/thioesterase domain-containing protein
MGMVAPASVGDLIVEGAARAGDSTALLAPGRPAASYRDLSAQARHVAGALRAHDVGSTDRVALLIEPGAEAATAFLGIASAAICAPLNPSYRQAELEFYLGDLQARALVVSSTLDTTARDVARALDIEVLELAVDESRPAGSFELSPAGEDAVDPWTPDGEAEALVLHTSGTTARPKIVPLAHRHLLASARNVAASLELRSSDRCLNVMPLFHIHGIVAALLSSLWARGSVVCAPGFHQVRFFEWLDELEPTWVTAVPTMYQSLLERVRRDPRLVERHSLRLLRSSSAPLPIPVLEALEEAFQVPVLEAYGMTEAAHQMASNPHPPGIRKPGSVGRPAGPEIQILDEAGEPLSAGRVGEVAIRGENVFDGYEANPDANAASFTQGWFRTGDQGQIDEDGYLVLLGRLKEIINRAGEKVSPLEVDEVLLRHPDVAQAVTFAMPDERLGEEVVAAVVPRSGVTLDAREIQYFVAQTVAPFKVPRRIVVVEEIPKGATGKVQRLSLADQLDVADEPSEAGSASRFLEESLCAIWSDVLGIPDVSPLDDFFALGGDSILGAEAIARARELIGKPSLPLVAIVRAPAPRTMAQEIEREFRWDDEGVVYLEGERGSGTPLFLIHGVDGDVVRFGAIARMLGASRPVYALRAPGFQGSNVVDAVEELAASYLDGIREVQPQGPYSFVSYCMGATVALELAHRLSALGEPSTLVLVDPRLQRPNSIRYLAWLVPRRLAQGRLRGAVYRRLRRDRPDMHASNPGGGPVSDALHLAREAYVPVPTSSPTAILRSRDFGRFEMPDWYLESIFRHTLSVQDIPGDHETLFQQPTMPQLADSVIRALDRVESPPT